VDVGQTRKGKVDVDRTFGVEALRDAIEELFEDVRDAGFVEAASFGEAEGVYARVRRGLLEEESSPLLGQHVELGVEDEDRRADRRAAVKKVGTSTHGEAAEAGKRYALGKDRKEVGEWGVR
jgi:hypothetical protein